MSEPLFRLDVLGTPALEGAGGIVGGPAGRAQSLVLLARLAVDGDAGTSRETLVSFFWPDSPAETGRHALSNLVYQVRKALGRDAIQRHGHALRLSSNYLQVDLWQFERALEAADEETAVRTYRGPFLDGLRTSTAVVERWIERERRKAADAYVGAIEALARSAAARNQAGRAAHWWRMAVEQNPLHAGRTCELMLWLARSGDPAGAVTLAGRHRALREEELGLGPEPAVQLLLERIRTGHQSVLSSVPNERDLAALLHPAPQARIADRSVAVLPFRILGDGSAPHVSNGFAMSLSHRLSGVEGLAVAVSSSAATLSDQTTDRREIAEKLGVHALLEGSVRRVGETLEVSAELIDTRTGLPSWSERITGSADDLLRIEDRIGTAVVKRFLNEAAATRPDEAHRAEQEDYLRGLFLESHLRWESTEESAAAFERVVEAAPDSADGWTALARASALTQLGVPTRDRASALALSLSAAERALELAPDSGDAHAAWGLATLFGHWDLMGARRAIYRATALGIRHPMALTWASASLNMCGDPGAAAALGAEAVGKDPFGYGTRLMRIWIARHAETQTGQYLEALVGQRPEGFWAPILWALAIPADAKKVIELTRFVFETGQKDPLPLALAAAARAQAGWMDEVDTALAAAESGVGTTNTRHTEQALVLSAASRRVEAGQAFVRALRHREPNTLFFWRDPILRPLMTLPDVAAAADAAGLLTPGPGVLESPSPPRPKSRPTAPGRSG